MEKHQLKEWLDRNEWTQARFARALEVRPETVSRWIHGSLPIDRRTELACKALEHE